jgi:hypothetical protein
MTDELWEQISKIAKERNDKAHKIKEKAIKEGTYVWGLDTNKELYREIDEEYKRKLKIILDEENAKNGTD